MKNKLADQPTNRIVKNTTMLFLMNVASMIFPLLTLPYLTRVLSNEVYGTVVYIRAIMGYMQTFVDFGFILSATKDIVRAKKNIDEIRQITSNTLLAKGLLAGIGLVLVSVLIVALPLLRNAAVLTLLFYAGICLSIFLLDFLFRGLERMEVITLRFVLMKGISTVLTFFLVKNDGQVIIIPLLEILGYLLAILLVRSQARKLNIYFIKPSIQKAWVILKESTVYFLSNVAATSYSALNTLILGIILTATEVAYWGVAMQIIAAIQYFYTPISNGIYPAMMEKRDFSVIKRVLLIFMPIITVGCVISYYLAPLALSIVGGESYVEATGVFRCLIPMLFLGFPALIFGWPTLGAIGKAKQNTFSTFFSLAFMMLGLAVLYITDHFTLLNVACLRSATEMVMVAVRLFFCWRYREEMRR